MYKYCYKINKKVIEIIKNVPHVMPFHVIAVCFAGSDFFCQVVMFTPTFSQISFCLSNVFFFVLLYITQEGCVSLLLIFSII